MQVPSKDKIAGSSPAEGICGGYGVAVTLLPVEEPSPVRIRLATQEKTALIMAVSFF